MTDTQLGFSKLPCSHCCEITLHRHDACIHCKTAQVHVRPDITDRAQYRRRLRSAKRAARKLMLRQGKVPKEHRGQKPRIFVEYEGKQLSLSQLAAATRLDEMVLRGRYELGDREPELWRPMKLGRRFKHHPSKSPTRNSPGIAPSQGGALLGPLMVIR